MSGINELAYQIHQTAMDHGWWEEPRTFGDIIALCHSELSEALEQHREGRSPTDTYYSFRGMYVNKEEDGFFIYDDAESMRRVQVPPSDAKPEGVPSELADCIIRILDYAEHHDIDMEEALKVKMAYNEGRPYRHGGKTL